MDVRRKLLAKTIATCPLCGTAHFAVRLGSETLIGCPRIAGRELDMRGLVARTLPPAEGYRPEGLW